MSTRVSSATNLSATYFMRNFYSNNRDAMKSSKRKEYSITELAYDDSTALHRAAKKLKNYKYSDDENTDNIRGTVMALVDTYNNSIDSASNSSSSSMKRYAKQLKKLASKYTDELEDIGITINKDGRKLMRSSSKKPTQTLLILCSEMTMTSQAVCIVSHAR